MKKRFDMEGREVTNALLRDIPDEEFEQLAPALEHVELKQGAVLHSAGDRLEYAVFPSSGLALMLIVTADARSVCVGMTGREGMTAVGLAAGLTHAAQRVVVQAPGEAHRMQALAVHHWLARLPEFSRRISQFALLQGSRTAQIAACHRLHEIEPRLARWLLSASDRVGGDVVPVTHEELSNILGSGRPSVTVAAGRLQRAGFIQYRRSAVKIVDRPGLQKSSCECYEVIRRFS